MKVKFMRLLLFVFLFFGFSPIFGDYPNVLVSLAPYKYFLERLSDNQLNVQLMVPPGASSHTYEPSPRQMVAASKGLIWFRIGEPFEEKAIRSLKSHSSNLEIVDLRKGLDLIHFGHAHKGCCGGCTDLHYWLSPRLMELQLEVITGALSRKFPENAEIYKKNSSIIQDELKLLDKEINTLLSFLKNRKLLVSHPAYAYFCRDYDLKQFSIEHEGRDPTPKQLTELMDLAKQSEFHTIFIQPQYGNKAAKLIAEAIGAKIVTLDPYSEDYFNSMRAIAKAFSQKDSCND